MFVLSNLQLIAINYTQQDRIVLLIATTITGMHDNVLNSSLVILQTKATIKFTTRSLLLQPIDEVIIRPARSLLNVALIRCSNYSHFTLIYSKHIHNNNGSLKVLMVNAFSSIHDRVVILQLGCMLAGCVVSFSGCPEGN